MTYIENLQILPNQKEQYVQEQPLDSTNHNHEQNLAPAANTSSEDWSYATEELLDTLPRPWTRGLLYFLVTFVAIALPWTMLYKVDETGTARGRLEPKGELFKVDAAVAGTVAKVLVSEGQVVKEKQPLVELESEPVQAELQQAQSQLEGQQNRLAQLELGKNQITIAIAAQQQQNKAQALEKLAQVAQAQQNLEASKATYNFQRDEKLAQVAQAQQNLSHTKTAYIFASSRFSKDQDKVQRYTTLYKEGAISKERSDEVTQDAEEKRRLQEQAESDILLAQSRLKEQQGIYQRIIRQAQADIKLAHSRLKEQQSSYQSIIQSGKLAVLESEKQLHELKTQISSLKAEISQTRSQIQSLNFQLAQRVLRAPVSGTIFQLPIQRPGIVLQPSQRVAEIAPQGEPLLLRAQIGTQESGSLREGMLVKMKFDAYPFQDYGVVEGRLSKISKTSKITETSSGTSANYDVEIELSKSCIQTGNECTALTAGQTATAEVVVRQRYIIDFIIDPFKKLQKGGLKL